MAYEIEVITDSRFADRYKDKNIEDACKEMLNKIIENLNNENIYSKVENDVRKLTFEDGTIQYRATLFIQLKKRSQKAKSIFVAVNSVKSTYFKRVRNISLNEAA